MEDEERRTFLIIGLICLFIVALSLLQLNDGSIKPPLRSPISQTEPLVEYSDINLSNSGVWINETEWVYLGTIEQDTGYKISIDESIVDSIQIGGSLP